MKIQTDMNVKTKLYKKDDYDHDAENATPIDVSHSKLGNGVHELVARKLDHHKAYVIRVVLADDDYDEKAASECLIATM